MKVSIATAYFNRRKEFIKTLESISFTEHDDYEVVATDDASDESERIDDLSDRFPFLKVIRIDPESKTWKNPCMAFNISIKNCSGDVLILQNPECYHVGDVVSTCNVIDSNSYITFACFSAGPQLSAEVLNFQHNKLNYFTEMFNRVKSIKPRSADVVGPIDSWFNHSTIRPCLFHFCSMITMDNMYKLGGFNPIFANGSGYDDNDLLNRIGKLGLNIGVVDFPFVIHQWHYDRPNGNFNDGGLNYQLNEAQKRLPNIYVPGLEI